MDHRAACAAVRLGDRHAQPAQLGHLLIESIVVVQPVAVGEPLALLLRPALALAEATDRGDEVLLLVGQREVHWPSSLLCCNEELTHATPLSESAPASAAESAARPRSCSRTRWANVRATRPKWP